MSLFGFGKKRVVISAFAGLGNISSYDLVLGYGIVNPFGPTLNLLAMDNSWMERGRSKTDVVLLQCHPFSPEILKRWQISTKKGDFSSEITRVIDDILLIDSGCPTLLIPGVVLTKESCSQIFRRIVKDKRSGLHLYNQCSKFRANAFDRITEEVMAMLKEDPPEPMGNDVAKEYVSMQMDKECMQSEMNAFWTAYDGAIGYQIQMSTGIQVELSSEELRRALNALLSEN